MAQQIRVLGIDIAKLVFHVVGMDDTGHVVLRKRIARSALLHCIATLPQALIGMEACGSAHDWARRFREHGHDVQLRLSRNSRENEVLFESQPNISNGLARRESEF